MIEVPSKETQPLDTIEMIVVLVTYSENMAYSWFAQGPWKTMDEAQSAIAGYEGVKAARYFKVQMPAPIVGKS